MSSWQQKSNITQGTVSRRTDLDGEVIEIIGDRSASLAW